MQFEICELDKPALEKWLKEHKCSMKEEDGSLKYTGAIGGCLTYSFTPTSIGTIASVKCCCGDEITLTDSL